MTKTEQIANQAKLISTLNANNAGLRRKIARLEKGQADLRAMLKPDIQPTTQDEWQKLINKAMAEIEAEHD